MCFVFSCKSSVQESFNAIRKNRLQSQVDIHSVRIWLPSCIFLMSHYRIYIFYSTEYKERINRIILQVQFADLSSEEFCICKLFAWKRCTRHNKNTHNLKGCCKLRITSESQSYVLYIRYLYAYKIFKRWSSNAMRLGRKVHFTLISFRAHWTSFERVLIWKSKTKLGTICYTKDKGLCINSGPSSFNPSQDLA